ncbi:MAG: SRPBCC family protein [Pseudomonadales bacterium]|nr:SRPBCC family protein [Pseudomonadales bacterium]
MSLRRTLRRSTWLERPVDEVFDFFADAGNLERITPPELRFRILTPMPVAMRTGALLDYRLSLYGVPFRWRTEITVWDPPSRFVDAQLAGPYRSWVHTHTFVAERGGTRMEDHVEYVLPLGRLGLLALPLLRRQLERIFDHRERVIRALLVARPGR